MLMKLYRLGHFCFIRRIPLIHLIVNWLIRSFYRCVIYSESDIGARTKLAYGGISVVIHRKAVIGEDCEIGSCTVIGGRSGHYEVPIIGNRCVMHAGSAVLGPITIGNDVTIGANAVVIESVPNGCTVAGVPAKIVKRRT